ncbi:MAG: glycosyltransferase [Ectobacillus sp.]
MKVLYISSGYGDVYRYFDQSITKALGNNKYEWRYFHPSESIEKLKSIVDTFQPQLALTLLGTYFSVQAVQYLKEKGVKLVCWMTEDPFYMDKTIEMVGRFDYIFTIDRGALKHYEAVHPKVRHLPLGTDPAYFYPYPVDEVYRSELLLIGYPYPTRVSLIQFLLEHTDYKITLVGRGWKTALRRSWRKSSKVKIHNKWIEPPEVARYYNGAGIVLNPHRTHDFSYNKNTLGVIGESINNRTFDIAACGAFQLIEAKPDLYSFFAEEEMVAYKSYEDCVHKVIVYMNDEKQRRAIAERARKAAAEKHTFAHRVKEIVETIKSDIG